MKVGVIQTCWQDDPIENQPHAYRAVDELCSREKLDIVCLPEFFLGPPWYMPGQDAMKGITDTPISGPKVQRFRVLARKHSVYLLLGSVVEQLPDGMYRNTSVLVDRSGDIAGTAYKAHAFANEMVVCRQAESIGLIDTEFGPIGIAVCSDFWVPETIRMLALAGAHTVLVPGGSLRQNLDAMVNAFRTTAFLNCVNLVYASPVGTVRGIRGDRQVEVSFAGTSLVADPGDIIAAGTADSPGTLVVDLDPGQTMARRMPNDRDDAWRGFQLRRPEAYQGLLAGYVGLGRDLASETRSSMESMQAVPAQQSGAA